MSEPHESLNAVAGERERWGSALMPRLRSRIRLLPGDADPGLGPGASQPLSVGIAKVGAVKFDVGP